MAKAFLVKPVTFAKGKLKYTAREGTPVIVLESEKQSYRIMFKYFFKWVAKRYVKLK